MAKAPIVLQFPAGGGLDQFTDPRHVEPVKLLDGKNLRIKKAGSYGKRRGMTTVIGAHSGVSGDARVYGLGDQVVCGDGVDLRSYTPTATGSAVSEKAPSVGKLPQAQVTRAGVFTGLTPFNVDIAYGGGCYCVCWTLNGLLYFEVYDNTTGAAFGYGQSPLKTGASYAKVAFLTDSFYVCVSYAANNNIDAVKVPLTGGAAATTTYNLIGIHQTAASFGLYATSARLIVVYQAGVNYVPSIETFNGAGVSQSGPTQPAEALNAQKYDFFVHADAADNAYFAYTVTSGGANYVRYSVSNATTTATVLAATTVVTHATDTLGNVVIYRDSATAAVIAYERDTVTGTGRWTDFATATSGGVVTALTSARVYWAAPDSGFAKRASGKFDIWLTCGGTFNSTVYSSGTKRAAIPAVAPVAQYTKALVTLSTASTGSVLGTPHAVTDMRVGTFSVNAVPSMVSRASNVYATAVISRRDAYNLFDVAIVEANFAAAATKWRGATIGNHLLLSGGTPTCYDGLRLREVGNVYDAQGPWSRTITGAAGAFAGAQTYFWCFVYRKTDRTGQVLRGIPSTPMDTIPAANDAVTFTVPTLSLTSEPLNGTACVECYRTTAGGTTFYLLDVAQNNITAATVTFTDAYTVTDAVLATRPQLYTTGGDTENVMPPASIAVMAHKQRAFYLERERIWFSKLFVDGSFPGFSDEFTLDLIGANLTACASLDDTGILFGRDQIWALVGDGPNDAGVGNDYQIRSIASDLGCTEAGSVVVHAGGVFFRSGAGLYNLSRGLQVEYLGRFVEDELTSATTITGAVVHPTDHCILFSLAGGTTGRRLVYDYLHQQWLKDECAADQYGLAVVGSRLYATTINAALLAENVAATATYLDEGTTWVVMSAKFGWTALPGSEWERIRAFGWTAKRVTDHGITVSVFNAYDDTPLAPQVWTSAQVAALPDLPVYTLDAANTYPLTDASTVQITDVSPTGLNPATNTGEGSTIIGVAIDAQQEQGTTRKAAANRR
jgi:hypothetical protein